MSLVTRASRLLRGERPAVGVSPKVTVFEENKWRLHRYTPTTPPDERRDEPGAPLLLIPSLINRHYVLDLLPGKSLVEWLVNAGHDVFVIDWGTPTDEDRYTTFDDVTEHAIGRALLRTMRATGADRVNVLGYCLGGTLAAIHAAAHPERFGSLALLAAPIAFGDDGLLSRWTRTRTFDVRALVAGAGNVPWQLMQAAFHLLRPTTNVTKAVSVIDRAWDDEFLDGFFAVETWGNDNVPFPGACYERYIEELYRRDALVRGAFHLAGRRVDLATIACPTLAVTFEHDGIVPWKSAAAILDHVSSTHKEHLHLPGGHVGAVVSRKAASGLWPALDRFFRA